MFVVMVTMVMVVVVAILFVAVGVTVTTKHNKTEQVGDQASTSNNENKLGLVNLGGFNESSQSFEDDGDAECDEEDGVEEGT